MFNLYMSDIPEPNSENGTGLVVYADDVTLTSTHVVVKVAEHNAQEYLNRIIEWMDINKLLLADKTQASLFTPDPAEYNYRLNLQIKGQTIDTTKNPNILGLTYDPKLTFNEHIKSTEAKAKGTLKLVKAISGTTWGQQAETISATYKTFTRPVLEYACPAWAPVISATSAAKLQRVQNSALRCATGHTSDTNTVHYHAETKVLPLHKHMRMISSQFRESARDPEHPQHYALAEPDPARQMKRTAFSPSYATLVHGCDNDGEMEKQIRRNQAVIHTNTVQEHMQSIPINPLIQQQPPEISAAEMQLPRVTRRTLAQLRAQKCPMLKMYLHHIGAADEPNCPLCRHPVHNTAHLFECPRVPTTLVPIDLWKKPVEVASLLDEWQVALALAEEV